MKPHERKPRYRAYLLRCWETQGSQGGQGNAWRFSIEDPHTGQRRNYAGLDLLIAALRDDLTESDETGASEMPDQDA